MTPSKYVRLCKIGAVDSPVLPPGDPATYPYGQLCLTGHSFPAGYVLEGWLVAPPAIGKKVEILRCARAGVAGHGYYYSTTVTMLGIDVFHTQNSIYRLVELSELPEALKTLALQHPGLSELNASA